MERALELATKGRGSVSPNPMVGCVIVHQDKIIGEGFHQEYGQPHAEVNAINSVVNTELLKESTVYVTLEPCAHHGKTPPCADLLIAKNVDKVVIACRDPFDQVDGKGIEKLTSAGVKVEVGIMEKEAKQLNARFFTSVLKTRPYVILKWAQSQDDFLARENYDSKWISNPYSRQLVHKWRSEEDAILVGKHTAIHDDPSLTVRDWDGKNPTRILLDSNLEVDKNAKLFDSNVKTIIFNAVKDDENENVHWIKTDLNNPFTILSKLNELRIQSVIIEGGSQVLNSFINENCWDEARVFTSKVIFEKGIKAPSLSGEIIEEQNIFGDELTIYSNKNG